MSDTTSPIGWRFLARWVTLTALGYSLGFLGGFVLGHLLLGNVMIGIGIGVGVGVMQWRVLRAHVPEAGRWMLVNAACLGLALAVFALVSFVSGYPMDLGWPLGVIGWAAAFFLGGTMVGSLERGALHRRIGRADGWVVACALGWALSVLALSIPPDMSGNLPLVLVLIRNALLAPVAAGVILGAVTGGALIRMQPLPRSEETPEMA